MRKLITLILIPVGLFAGAFVQDKGKSFLSLQFWTYNTRSYWDRNGNKRNAHNHFVKREINTYYEYGLTNKTTFVAKVLYDWIWQTVTPRKTTGFEDPEFGLRHLVWKNKKRLLSIEGTLIIPSGPDNKPALRYGCFGAQATILYAGNFKYKDHYGFYVGEIGYRWYRGYPSDQIRANLGVGYDFTKRFQLIAAYFLEYGVFNGTPQVNFNIITLDPNYRLLKGTLTAVYRFSPKTSLTLGYYRHVWGQNTGTGQGFYGGLWLKF